MFGLETKRYFSVVRYLAGLRARTPARLKTPLRPLRDQSVALWHRHVRPGFARRLKQHNPSTMPEVSILLVTHNRLRMLRECLTSLLEKTLGVNFEVVVWDNGSDDGTKDYLDAVAREHPEVRVFHHPENVGLNGLARSVELARGLYLVELDDDVVLFPDEWLPRMLRAFRTVPRPGYLAANVVQDARTDGNKPSLECYTAIDYDGTVLEHGPAGGWCTMTSLEVMSRIGNFPRRWGRCLFCQDGDYARRCREAGFNVGVVQEVLVYHAAGPAVNDDYGYLAQYQQKYAEEPQYDHQYRQAQRYVQGREAAKD